jgi:hypothetical protein
MLEQPPAAPRATGLVGSMRWWQRPRVWQMATLLLACTSLGLGARVALTPHTIQRVVYVYRPSGGPAAPAVAVHDNSSGESAKPIRFNASATRTQFEPSERWLTAMAAPDFQWRSQLRARASRASTDPATPIVVLPARRSVAGVASSHNEISPRTAHPLRWSDQRVWTELIGASQ